MRHIKQTKELSLLHSERPKLHRVLVVLSSIGLRFHVTFSYISVKFQQAQRRDDGYQKTLIRKPEKNHDLSRIIRVSGPLASSPQPCPGQVLNFSTSATGFPTSNISCNAFTDKNRAPFKTVPKEMEVYWYQVFN